MAQLLAINDVIRAQIVCADGAQGSFNTVYYQVTGVGVSIATLEDFAKSFDALVAPDFKPLLYNGAGYDGVIAQVIQPLPLMARVFDTTNAGAGTAGAVGLPKQTSGLVQFRTDFAGPGFRGRNFLPFPSASSNQLDGLPTAAYHTAALIYSEALRNFVTVSQGGRTATVRMGLWKRAGAIFTPVTSTVASGNWATQKRRGDFGKANVPPI